MIVCSCNVVSHEEIEAAVEELVAGDPDVVLTPGMVYRAIGVRPKCGTCLQHAVKLMHAHRECLNGTACDGTACHQPAPEAAALNGSAANGTCRK